MKNNVKGQSPFAGGTGIASSRARPFTAISINSSTGNMDSPMRIYPRCISQVRQQKKRLLQSYQCYRDINKKLHRISLEDKALPKFAYESLILAYLHQRDVFAEVANGVDLKSCASFEWQKHCRHYWSFEKADSLQVEIEDKLIEDDKIIPFNSNLVNDKSPLDIRILGLRESYKFNYNGFSPKLVMTPLVGKCFYAMFQGLQLCTISALFGSGGIGKTAIVEDMSRMCGQLMHTLVCSKMTKMETIMNAMNGLAMTGIWLVFDKFNSMPNNIMTMATNIAEKYLLAKHLKCKTHSNDGEVQIMNFNAEGAIVSIMNPILRVNTEREFPPHIRRVFRPYTLIQPNRKAIFQAYFTMVGFKTHNFLATIFDNLYTYLEANTTLVFQTNLKIGKILPLIRRGKLNLVKA